MKFKLFTLDGMEAFHEVQTNDTSWLLFNNSFASR